MILIVFNELRVHDLGQSNGPFRLQTEAEFAKSFEKKLLQMFAFFVGRLSVSIG